MSEVSRPVVSYNVFPFICDAGVYYSTTYAPELYFSAISSLTGDEARINELPSSSSAASLPRFCFSPALFSFLFVSLASVALSASLSLVEFVLDTLSLKNAMNIFFFRLN